MLRNAAVVLLLSLSTIMQQTAVFVQRTESIEFVRVKYTCGSGFATFCLFVSMLGSLVGCLATLVAPRGDLALFSLFTISGFCQKWVFEQSSLDMWLFCMTMALQLLVKRRERAHSVCLQNLVDFESNHLLEIDRRIRIVATNLRFGYLTIIVIATTLLQMFRLHTNLALAALATVLVAYDTKTDLYARFKSVASVNKAYDTADDTADDAVAADAAAYDVATDVNVTTKPNFILKIREKSFSTIEKTIFWIFFMFVSSRVCYHRIVDFATRVTKRVRVLRENKTASRGEKSH